MKSKKGQGISINVIIVAAVALIVLVVLIAVFTGRIGIFGKELDKQTMPKCTDSGGTPMVAQECSTPIYGNYEDVNPGEVCCKAEP